MIALFGEKGLLNAIEKAGQGRKVQWIEGEYLEEALEQLMSEPYECIIIDVGKTLDDPLNSLPMLFGKLIKATTKKVVAIGMGLKNTDVHIRLKKAGVKYFIDSNNISDLIDSLREVFQNLPQVEDPILQELIENSDHVPVEVIEHSAKSKQGAAKKESYQSVSIAGLSRGVGTTTQCIQLIKHLSINGYKACYVEKNNHAIVRTLIDTDVEIDQLYLLNDNLGIEYHNVDMFLETPKLYKETLNEFDYVVFDYGVLTEANNADFFSRDYCIVNVSTSMWHYIGLVEKFASFSELAPWLALGPTDTDTRKKLMESLGSYASRAIFPEFTPDMFTYNAKNAKYYNNILGKLKLRVKEKKGLFRGWKK